MYFYLVVCALNNLLISLGVSHDTIFQWYDIAIVILAMYLEFGGFQNDYVEIYQKRFIT